ncbi:hypothetical protein COV19_00270 [Candidatus Woesearchaeota archaeon CG10_big_fil_rev_8_21_14_0_10_44_13]|nr:MAG: hypothetical protein COV19_00270 [Candidatus Woesearchaeota archaeon CG10_big_fil_rev_8_21_14_0_10_44_13]
MSGCHKHNNADQGKKTSPLLLAIGVIVVLALIFFVRNQGKDDGRSIQQISVETEKSAAAGNSSDYVRIPLSELSSTLKKYTYDVNGVQVRFFAVLGSDGKARTAIDACDVCGGYGYIQEGGDVSCKKCGRSFGIDDIGTKNTPGGCWPSYLANSVDGDYVSIGKKDLEKAASRFA